MNTTRGCGCKGYRSCRICEDQLGIVAQEVGQVRASEFTRRVRLCLGCGGVFFSDNDEACPPEDCSAHLGSDPFDIGGLKAGFIFGHLVLRTHTWTMSRDVPDIRGDRADFCQC